MGRTIASVVAGGMLGFICVMAFDILAQTVFTIPEGLDPLTPEGMRAIVAQMPLTAQLLVLAGPVVGAGLGAITASRIAASGSAKPGFLVMVMMLGGTLANAIRVDHALWFSAIAVIGVIAAGWFGATIGAAPASRAARPVGA